MSSIFGNRLREKYRFMISLQYFIFQMIIHRFKNIGRIGTMHLIATNLCMWIRSLVVEEYTVIQEIGEK